MSKFADMAGKADSTSSDVLSLARAVGVYTGSNDINTNTITDLMNGFEESPDETAILIRLLDSEDAYALAQQLQNQCKNFDKLNAQIVMSELLRHHPGFVEASSDTDVSSDSLENSLEKATNAALSGRRLSKLYFRSKKQSKKSDKPSKDIVPISKLVSVDDSSELDKHLAMFVETTLACEEML